MSDYVFIIHQESDNKWVWHLLAPDEETIANSSNIFETADECLNEVNSLIMYVPSAKILKK